MFQTSAQLGLAPLLLAPIDAVHFSAIIFGSIHPLGAGGAFKKSICIKLFTYLTLQPYPNVGASQPLCGSHFILSESIPPGDNLNSSLPRVTIILGLRQTINPIYLGTVRVRF